VFKKKITMFTSLDGDNIRRNRTVITTRLAEELVRIVNSLYRAIPAIPIDWNLVIGALYAKTLDHGDAVSDVIEVAL
jgi:hypothetical protein